MAGVAGGRSRGFCGTLGGFNGRRVGKAERQAEGQAEASEQKQRQTRARGPSEKMNKCPPETPKHFLHDDSNHTAVNAIKTRRASNTALVCHPFGGISECDFMLAIATCIATPDHFLGNSHSMSRDVLYHHEVQMMSWCKFFCGSFYFKFK